MAPCHQAGNAEGQPGAQLPKGTRRQRPGSELTASHITSSSRSVCPEKRGRGRAFLNSFRARPHLEACPRCGASQHELCPHRDSCGRGASQSPAQTPLPDPRSQDFPLRSEKFP